MAILLGKRVQRKERWKRWKSKSGHCSAIFNALFWLELKHLDGDWHKSFTWILGMQIFTLWANNPRKYGGGLSYSTNDVDTDGPGRKIVIDR
ncbi:hypothetical protein YC2023_119952 [Brassica napus]